MREWVDRLRYGKQYGYERLFRQQSGDLRSKVGVILADTGVPEDYDPQFYVDFMEHIFRYSLPPFLHRLVLADRGIALIDPNRPLERQRFEPTRLVDMYGSETNRAGCPYVECNVRWRAPGMSRNPWDHGYFLYSGDGKAGAPDICQKTAAKIAGWYFGELLPAHRVPWHYQCGLIYQDVVSALRPLFPDVDFRQAAYMSADSLQRAVDELLVASCETIIYQSFTNPVYSDLEEYSTAFPLVHSLVNGRANLVFADQPGNQAGVRRAFAEMLRHQLVQVPQHNRVLVILSRHGHPFRRETMDERGQEYRQPLEAEMRGVLSAWGGYSELLWSDDEFADTYWDPKHRKLETREAHRIAIEREFDYALELPTEFVAENTDTMILHAMKKYTVYGNYDPGTPVHYPDWDQPLVRVFRQGKTTGIYLGCPVGPYRGYVVDAVVGSILSVLNC